MFNYNYLCRIYILDRTNSYLKCTPGLSNDWGSPHTYVVDGTREVEMRAKNDRFYSEFRKFIDSGYDLTKTIKPGHLNIYKKRDMLVNPSGPDCLDCCSPQKNLY